MTVVAVQFFREQVALVGIEGIAAAFPLPRRQQGWPQRWRGLGPSCGTLEAGPLG